MRRLLISILLLWATALMATAQPMRHEIKVGNFTRLALLDDINVNYRCNPDSAGMVIVVCPKETIDNFIFTLSASGRLAIQIEDTYERQGNLPTLTVYSSTLDEVENSSDSTLRILGLPRLKSFKARLVDNGRL